MVKIASLLLLLITIPFSFSNKPQSAVGKVDAFELTLNSRNNYTITAVRSNHLNDDELRIYHNDNEVIDEISDDALMYCTNLSKLMISYDVKYIGTNSLNISTLEIVNYTGSEEEFSSLGLVNLDNFVVNYYACDEGFIRYWNNNVRPSKDINICDMSRNEYLAINSLYKKLCSEDMLIVNSYKDVADAKIEDSMKQLAAIFNQEHKEEKKEPLTTTGAIILILSVAFVGMTSICLFYLFKQRQFIE